MFNSGVNKSLSLKTLIVSEYFRCHTVHKAAAAQLKTARSNLKVFDVDLLNYFGVTNRPVEHIFYGFQQSQQPNQRCV